MERASRQIHTLPHHLWKNCCAGSLSRLHQDEDKDISDLKVFVSPNDTSEIFIFDRL